MNIKSLGLEELSLSEKKNVNGGFPWGWFWSGCKIGLAGGFAVGTAYYFA